MFNLNKEAKLAYTMLIPTISIVFLIILFPIFGNFWLSFKEVKLGDLRAPQPIIKEKLKTKDIEPGDDILIDPEYLDLNLDFHIEKNLEYSNNKDLPSGCEVEIFDVELLKIQKR